MKPERAEELYSDYAEGTLTPALRQALEQHFEADPSARADYAGFAKIYTFLEQPGEAEVEAPLGFRAKILERVASQQTVREATWSQRTATLFTGWFLVTPQRRLAGGALAGVAVAVLAGVMWVHPLGNSPKGNSSNAGFNLPPPPPPIIGPSDPAVIRNVDMPTGLGDNAYYKFHLHLPPSVVAATVNAYVVTSVAQITDPAQLGTAIPALIGQHLTNHQGVQIPIAPQQTPPVGATLGLLVKWTPDDTSLMPGSEVVYTPFGSADPTTPAPINAGILDTLKAVAARYGVTVVVDADEIPTQTVTPDFSATDASVPLGVIAKAAGYSVQTLDNKTFYLYNPNS
jgi:hypothetical protein